VEFSFFPDSHFFLGHCVVMCFLFGFSGNISHLVFRSDNNNNGARRGFKGYLQCFRTDMDIEGEIFILAYG